MKDKIEKLLIEVALKIARQGKGCIFVIREKDFEYESLFGEDIKPFNIFDNERRLEVLGMIDGACIINLDGNLISYGVKIKDINKPLLKGFGTRHNAAYIASLSGNLVIIASEEDRKVKLLKSGKILMQLDSLEKGVEKNVSKSIELLEALGAGSLIVIGSPLIAPQLMTGITFVTGIIIYGSGYYFFKNLSNIVERVKLLFNKK